MQKLPCAICGSENVHGHHDDYSKPLEVIWLCHEHHMQHHQEMLKASAISKATGE